jgi:3-oxoacyl-[acyl-carrier protein] reductase
VVTIDLSPAADITLDVSDSAAVAAAAHEIGPVDILVNSAGMLGPSGSSWEVSDAAWAQTLAVNLTGTFYTCRAFIPGMVERGWGRVVNVASMAAKEGNAFIAAYAASKAGVVGLTKSLGKETATTGVLVNAVTPGLIATAMTAGPPEQMAQLAGRIPMRRIGEAAEVAELVAWLASDACSYSTGAVYDISGGQATY